MTFDPCTLCSIYCQLSFQCTWMGKTCEIGFCWISYRARVFAIRVLEVSR